MSAYTDGSWQFRALVEPTKKQWEVSYMDRSGISRRDTFHTEIEANKFAAQCGGKAKFIQPRGGYGQRGKP